MKAAFIATMAFLLLGSVRSTEAQESTEFLNFPVARSVCGASAADAFAWIVSQAGRTQVLFARAPGFSPVILYSKTDQDGQPITAVSLSPDGRFAVFQTGERMWGEKAYNPASLIPPPELTLWVVQTESGAQARKVGPGMDPVFAGPAARVIYRHGEDLLAADLSAPIIESRVVKHGKSGEQQWLRDGSALAFVDDHGAYAFLGLYRPGADHIDWLVTGADRLRAVKWSPDGTRLAYLRLAGREHSKAYDIGASEAFSVEVVDVGTHHIRTVWQSPGRATFPYFNTDTAVRWAGNDRIVFYSEHDGWGRLYSIAAGGGKPTAITPSNCEVAADEYVEPNQLLVVHNCPDLNTRHLSMFDPGTGKRQDIANSDLVITSPVRSAGRYIAFAGGGADTAPMLRILDVQTRKIVFTERPLDHGYQPTFKTRAPQAVTFQAEDGVTVPAQLFTPATPGRHPAVVYFHGGPYKQMFPAFHPSGAFTYMYAMNRQLAELGYVVLSVNYRGSEGYGLEFREHPERAWRGASEVRDAAAAARWLASRPDVDGTRIGAWGGSYGGLMTAQSLARHSDLFKAGVALYGLYDWTFSSANSGYWNPGHDFGVSEQTRKQAFESSPVGALDTWTAPVLLVTGDADIYVDVAQTVDLAQRLRDRHIDVALTMIPNESHGFVLHQTQVRLWRDMSDFFGRHL
jgi:dipeptidyl aminopeptidase/acylaminoacyl peptidase